MDKANAQTASLLQRELQRLLAAGSRQSAIRLLDRIIDFDGGLFSGLPETLEQRRLAWLLKIDLFREAGQLSEALAWICLECEINPDNVAAQALKEQIKRQLGLSRPLRGNPVSEAGASIRSAWEGVAGMRELRAVLERDVVLPLREQDVYERYRVSLPNGVLLYGPPGCGKTFIAQKLASEIEYKFIEVKPSDIASPYVHGTQEKIGELFDRARASAPCILFLDELDAIVPNRDGASVGFHYGSEVNEFLIQFNDAAKRKILIIGATNLLDHIDPAILRPGRMDKKIYIGPPDMEARLEAFKLHVKDRPQASIDWVALAEASEYYTHAELEHVVNEAARAAIPTRELITTASITAALKSNPPALTREAVEKYRASA